MKNKILILCGKSGSGKDFIQRQLIKNENFKQIVDNLWITLNYENFNILYFRN